jgi:hypothetical protein
MNQAAAIMPSNPLDPNLMDGLCFLYAATDFCTEGAYKYQATDRWHHGYVSVTNHVRAIFSPGLKFNFCFSFRGPGT